MAHRIHCTSTQFLCVVHARDLGLGPHGDLIEHDERMGSVEDLGLRPLLVYTLVLPPYGQYWQKLVDPREPESLSSFLFEAWSDPGGFGVPSIVEVKKGLMDLDAGFLDWIRLQGVEVRLPRNIKMFAGREVHASRLRHEVDLFKDEFPDKDGVAVRNECLKKYREFTDAFFPYQNYSMDAFTFEAFMKRERVLTSMPPLDTDWDAASLPKAKAPKRPDPDLVIHNDDPYHSVAHIPGAKAIINQWPGGRSRALKKLEIKSTDFDFWASGRADLEERQIVELVRLLNAEPDRHSDFHGQVFELAGGLLLISRTQKEICDAWDELSHGGDVSAAFEILGPEGQTTDLRFVFMEAYGCLPNIFLVTPELNHVVNRQKLINLQDPVCAPMEVWDTVQLIVRQASYVEDPKALPSMFSASYREWLDSHSVDSF